MNLQFHLEKLFSSKEFEEFKKENADAYICSGFIVIDKEGKDSKVHIDYFVPSTKKMFSFQIENSCEKIPVEQIPEEAPQKISDNLDFNFEEIEKLISERIQKENVKTKIQKILLSLQKFKGKDFLIGTIFISGLGMIKTNIDIEKKEIIEFEKKSFFDILKVKRKKKDKIFKESK